ncbi:MAG: dTDP-4-dehydrorhamnose reductase [Actinomycetia bacterium]|nr:dTDP-4-dehydrorhamnose reductase [Actinomycetes bacterium]
MKIIITGADGQLGSELQKVLDGHDLYPVDIEELDITDFQEVKKQVSSFGPEIIFHVAAFTDVDGAELNPDLAYKVNAIGTRNLSVAARGSGAAILYVSTDFVFDGRKETPYTEFDDVNPLSVYGRSKLAGERDVQTLAGEHYICRTAWLYGRDGQNFVKTMLSLGQEGQTIRVVDDQMGSPTSAADLAKKIVEIGLSGRFGVYHTTNSGAVSWYGFAKKVFELAKITPDLQPIGSDQMERPAKRPAFSVLRGLGLELQGMQPMRPWDEALAEYFTSRH